MSNFKIKLHPKTLKESKNRCVCSVRLSRDTAAKLDILAAEGNMSRSKLISNILNATTEYVVISDT